MERQYRQALTRLTTDINRTIAEQVAPLLAEAQRREDADIDPSRFLGIFSFLRVRIAQISSGAVVSRILDQFGRAITQSNGTDLERILNISFSDESPDVLALLQEWREENLRLIQSLSNDVVDQVSEQITQATIRGTRVETLRRLIQNRFNVARSRAELIAVDQTLKANAALTRVRHQEAGITQYVWSTSRDERVRDRHRDLEGRVFDWDSPPVTNDKGERNHPGEDIRCRCVAIAVIPD